MKQKNKKIKVLLKGTKGKILILDAISFLLGFQQALVIYITSEFLKENSGIENVGVFYFIAYSASLLIMLNLHNLIGRYGRRGTFFLLLFAKFAVLLGVGLYSDFRLATIFVVWMLTIGPLLWVALDVLIEQYTESSCEGASRGKHLSLVEFGMLCGPLITTAIVGNFGFRWVFVFAASIVFIVLALSAAYLGKRKKRLLRKRKDVAITEVLKKVARRKNIQRIYYISFLLEFFYAIMIVYTPIYFLETGISWEEMGKIFTIMLLPFVLFQYPAGVLADKKYGEKEMLFAAIILMGLSTAWMTYVQNPTWIAWAVLLFLGRTGAALVQTLRDSYFYKRVSCFDYDIIDFFRTTRSLAYILATALSAVLLAFFPLKFVFLFLGVVILTGVIPLVRLQDSK